MTNAFPTVRLTTLVFISAMLLATLAIAAGEENGTSGNEYTSSTSEPQQQNDRGRVFVPGDAVMISNLPDTTSFLNDVFPIDDRGFIDLPIYGRAKISHMTRSELLNFLRNNFKDYLRFNYLQVKPLIRASILGGVALPGMYYIDPDRSLWDLYHMAGGTLDEDGLKDSKWMRDGDDVESDVIPILQRGASLKTIGFRTGDQVWVRSPDRPGFWDNFNNFTSVLTLATTTFAIYLSYESIRRNNR